MVCLLWNKFDLHHHSMSVGENKSTEITREWERGERDVKKKRSHTSGCRDYLERIKILRSSLMVCLFLEKFVHRDIR